MLMNGNYDWGIPSQKYCPRHRLRPNRICQTTKSEDSRLRVAAQVEGSDERMEALRYAFKVHAAVDMFGYLGLSTFVC